MASVSASIDLKVKSYTESRSYSDEPNPGPSRSQTLIYRQSNDSQWWLTVTFRGRIDTALNERTLKRDRRTEFQSFVKLIDYSLLTLLDDTVTEVILEEVSTHQSSNVITLHPSEESIDDNPFAKIAGKMTWTVREYPGRVSYPSCDEFPSFECLNLNQFSKLCFDSEVAPGVFQVIHLSTQTTYIIKVVNRPLYDPHDTEAIRKELENLMTFRSVPNIVQAAGIAVSTNPYLTSTRDQPLPSSTLRVMGIVLEYHSGGSIQKILDEERLSDFSWELWPLQIATALALFHAAGKTHVDLKPSNIVVDADGNAVLIDISGIGGFTHKYCAPGFLEMCAAEIPFEIRRSNDAWAFGKTLLDLIESAEESDFARMLQGISDRMLIEHVDARMTLLEAISELELVCR